MATAIKEGRPIRGAEAVAERPDGSRVPFIPFPTPLRDASGRLIGAVNMLVDISERKKAEELQRVLIDELNHRVKNTLATVQSIAAQTFRATPDPQAFTRSFESRLVALSKAHDLLAERRWAGVTLGELLETELAPFAGEGGSRIGLDGTDTNLPPRVALVLAMVVHELAVNASRHGALSIPEGRVTFGWRVDVLSGAGRVLVMKWRESGGPAVVANPRPGFGTRIVERSISRDLGGTVNLRYAADGLSAEITIPLT